MRPPGQRVKAGALKDVWTLSDFTSKSFSFEDIRSSSNSSLLPPFFCLMPSAGMLPYLDTNVPEFCAGISQQE